jgi:hypothetical protein
MRRALLLALLGATPWAALGDKPAPASPLLPPDHWAVEAAERLHEVGLAPRWLPAQRAVPILVVARTLETAASEGANPWASLAHAWVERFHSEFAGAAAPHAETWQPRVLGAACVGGYEWGTAEPLRGAPPPGPAALHLVAPRPNPFAELRAAATLGQHLAAGARVHATPWHADLPELEAVGTLGPVALSVGQAPIRYGPNDLGAIVMSGAASLERIELMTTSPVRLPGPLHAVGDLALDLAVARFSESRHPYDPLLWEFQLLWRPHPRLTLGAIRGVMFGGALWEGIPASQVPVAMLGIKNYRENNGYSVSMKMRLPTESLLPLTAKLEWGSDDNPGAALQWPGVVAGLSSPMLPGLPAALGVEYAYFGRGPFGYHDPFGWYAHGQYVGGWATGQAPLGDPLGGNGRALRVVASADPFDARARVKAAAWVQDRFADNLYAPAAGGRSVGFRGEAEVRLGRGAVGARGSYERGDDGWSRSELTVGATVFF